MYLRCSFESKPTWKGNSRVLFQNKSSHNPAKMRRSLFPSPTVGYRLKVTQQRSVAAEAIPIRTIHKGQLFFIASSVRVPPAMELPDPGVFAVEADTARRQEEPANDASQRGSLCKLSSSVVKVSQSAGGPL